MNHLLIKRLVAVTLFFCVALSCFVACDTAADTTPGDDTADLQGSQEGNGTEQTAATAYTLSNLLEHLNEYTVIRSDNATDTVKQLCLKLRLVGKNELGKEPGITTDWADPSNPTDPDALEILVGDTNRPESAQAKEMLTASMDHLVVQIDNKICVVAHDDAGIRNGVYELMSVYLHYDVQSEYHNVWHYGAIGNGMTDDTQAFKAAIAAAEADGLPVYVPAGSYVITETLVLNSVTLYGYTTGAWTADSSDLPVVYHKNLKEPLFDVVSGSLSGLHLIVDGVNSETTADDAVETVRLTNSGARVSNVKITMPFIGIATFLDPTKSTNPGRCFIENIFIVQAYDTGVYVHGTWDVATLCNIEVWNPSTYKHPCPTAYRFGKNDDMRATNLFSFNTVVGFAFEESVVGANGAKGGCWGSFANCSADLSQRCIQIRGGHHNLTFVGGTYWAHHYGLEVTSATADTTRVTMNGCEIVTNGAQPISVSGGMMTTVSGCNLVRIASAHSAEVIKINAGNGVTITGNTISAKNNAVTITSSFKGAANITGNTILCSKLTGAISNQSKSTSINTDGNVILYNFSFD